MPNFFAEKNNINLETKEIILDEETSHHISKVLRYKEGDKITASSEMINYNCIIKSISNSNVTLSIESECENKAEYPFEVNLYQGIAKGEKMDNIIQKATELGVTNIIPVETKFTVVKLIGDDKVSKKIERWNKISKEAAKQSERGRIPTVTMPLTFKESIKKCVSENSIALVCYGRENNYNLKMFFKDKNISKENISNIKSFSFFIGPEGGFDVSEIDYAKENGIESVSLGERILRTETASGALLSMLEYELF